MLVLYGNPLSTYCAKVRVVLRHKQVEFEDRAPPDGYGSDAYREIVPMGTVPGFVDGDLVLSESEAIAEYLEERFPEPPMLFGDAAGRARIRALSRIHDCWVEPQLRALFAHASPYDRDENFVVQKVREFNRRLQQMSELVTPAPFLAGRHLSLADCAWATTFIQTDLLFAALGHELLLPPSLLGWREALTEHPDVLPGLAPCAMGMQTWLQSRGAV